MLVNPYQIRTMLRTYGKQLVNAKRLARFQRYMRTEGDRATISREARRMALVEKVSREIIDNLLVAGADNPLVQEIRAELEQRFGARLLFEYPFMEQDLQVYRGVGEPGEAEEPGGAEPLAPEEANEVFSALWEITTRKVNETMI